jgi:hypothetical protein
MLAHCTTRCKAFDADPAKPERAPTLLYETGEMPEMRRKEIKAQELRRKILDTGKIEPRRLIADITDDELHRIVVEAIQQYPLIALWPEAQVIAVLH